MKKYLIFCCVIFVVVSCNSGDTENIYVSNYEEKYTLRVIDSLTYNHVDTLFIGRIHDIQLVDEKILISDFFLKRVWVFSKDLKLLKIVGREGKGPGEYSYPPNIMYDSNYVWFHLRRSLDKYNKNLEFINRLQLPEELIYKSNPPISLGDYFIFNVVYPSSIAEKSYFNKYKPLIRIDSSLKNYVNFDDWDKNYYNDDLEGYTRERHEALVANKDENHFFSIQGATYYIKHYDRNINLIKHFGRKPKRYKNPPKLKLNDTQSSVEANAEFHSNITSWHNIKYDINEKRLYLGYTNLFKDFYLYRSLMRGEHFLQVFDEDYDVIFDGKIPGRLAFVDKGNIYIINKEEPEFLKFLICRLETKDK